MRIAKILVLLFLFQYEARAEEFLERLSNINEIGHIAYDYYYQEDYNNASRYFEKMYQLTSEDIKISFYLFKSYYFSKQYEKAITALMRIKHLIEVEPNPLIRMKYFFYLGRTHKKIGNKELSEFFFKKVIFSRPVNSKKYWWMKGCAHNSLQDEQGYLCWRNVFDLLQERKGEQDTMMHLATKFFPISDNLKLWYEQEVPKTYLLSYPRSGNTWLRYIIEAVTGRPTLEKRSDGIIAKHDLPLGYWLPLGTVFSKTPVWKVHHKKWMQEMGTFDQQKETLILVVRNYKEVLTRHLKKQLTAEMLKNPEDRWDSTSLYFENLALFDSWNQERRHLIYYEDLITDPKKVICDLVLFLGCSADKLNLFMEKYEEHRDAGVEVYSKHASSITQGKHPIYHSKNIQHDEKLAIDDFIQKKYPNLFDRYLARYKENEIL